MDAAQVAIVSEEPTCRRAGEAYNRSVGQTKPDIRVAVVRAGTHYVVTEPVTADDRRGVGAGLARVHRTDISHCPFDQRLASQIDAARQRVAAGLVRENDFDEVRAGRPAVDLFEELLSTVPADEDLVFTHGDYCLPNIILNRGANDEVEIAGLVDCGRAGVADRHQDIALAVRSIIYNFGDIWVAPFLESDGLPQPREEKVRFYTLLDEFF